MKTLFNLSVALFLSLAITVSAFAGNSEKASAAKFETSFLILKDGKLTPVFTKTVNNNVYCFSVYDGAGAQTAIASYSLFDPDFMSHGYGIEYVPTQAIWANGVCYFFNINETLTKDSKPMYSLKGLSLAGKESM